MISRRTKASAAMASSGVVAVREMNVAESRASLPVMTGGRALILNSLPSERLSSNAHGSGQMTRKFDFVGLKLRSLFRSVRSSSLLFQRDRRPSGVFGTSASPAGITADRKSTRLNSSHL